MFSLAENNSFQRTAGSFKYPKGKKHFQKPFRGRVAMVLETKASFRVVYLLIISGLC